MQDTVVEQALAHWSSGEALQAGRLIYENIASEQRPQWAAAILDVCRPLLLAPVPEIEAVYGIALAPSRWPEAHQAFSAVRRLTLEAEDSEATPRLYKGVLYVAENAAKVVYNASGNPAPFDHNAGWWLVSNIRFMVDEVNNPDFAAKAWAAVV